MFLFPFIFSDFVVSLKTLRSFYLVIAPLLEIPLNRETRTVSSKMLTAINNQMLPLAYLDCQDIRVIVPSADLVGNGAAHDVIIFQVNKNNTKILKTFLKQIYQLAQFSDTKNQFESKCSQSYLQESSEKWYIWASCSCKDT